MENRIPTNLRAMLILEALGDEGGPLSASDIGRRVGIPKQTAHRLCNTLVDEGYLHRDIAHGLLRPGRRAREMASSILHASVSHIARHQVLEGVAKEIGETVNFVVPEAQGMSYKDRVETNWPFRVQLPVGSHVPFYCTASGKTFLATLPSAERRRLVHVMQLEPLTKNTITDADVLLKELKAISRRGYGLDEQEFYDGMVALAVPVRDPNGRYLASLAVHGPAQRVSCADLETKAPVLFEAAEQLKQIVFA